LIFSSLIFSPVRFLGANKKSLPELFALEGFKTQNIAISGQFKTSGHINADCVKEMPPGAQGGSGAKTRLLSQV
jgi:hypothetical protein